MAQQQSPSLPVPSSSFTVEPAAKNPFDWLQGSLFFGGIKGFGSNNNSSSATTMPDAAGGTNSNTNTEGNESALIDKCTDTVVLLTGVSENLHFLILQNQMQNEDGTTREGSCTTTTSTDIQQRSNDQPSQTTDSLHCDATEVTDSTLVASPSDKIAARLSRLRFLLYDERRITSQQPPHLIESKKVKPMVAEATINAVTGDKLQRLIVVLLENMILLPFESRKHVTAIFNYLLVCGLEGVDAPLYSTAMIHFVSYVEEHYEQIMTLIVNGHDVSQLGVTPDVALHFGSMYRSCTRHPTLYQQLVGTYDRAQRFVYPFLDDFAHMANFEISSDAMESLRSALAANTERGVPNAQENQIEQTYRTRIADIAADFLHRDYTAIWDDRFTAKLLSDTANYMSRRVALQILSTVLLTRSNYSIMIQYVASRSNLIVVMHLLRDTSPHITLDAFHVFKVFVANPNKPPEIVKILHDNKSKLCAYLTTLHQEKEENDTLFRDEKALIIATIDAQ
jgi:calcium binding protein 39